MHQDVCSVDRSGLAALLTVSKGFLKVFAEQVFAGCAGGRGLCAREAGAPGDDEEQGAQPEAGPQILAHLAAGSGPCHILLDTLQHQSCAALKNEFHLWAELGANRGVSPQYSGGHLSYQLFQQLFGPARRGLRECNCQGATSKERGAESV